MILIPLIIIVIFFILAALFAGLETGLISIDKLRLEQESKTDKTIRNIYDLTRKPDKIFGMTLAGTNISQVIISSLFAAYIIKPLLIEENIGTIILSIFMLIFAEIIPKNLFRDYSYLMVSKTYPLIKISGIILKPFIWGTTIYNSFIARHLNVEQSKSFLTCDDWFYLFSQTETKDKTDDSLKEEQREMLEDALEFKELKAKNAMIPRIEIVAFEADTSLEDVIKIARKEGFTRFPVYKEDLDHIVGILIIYDLLNYDKSKKMTAGDFVREALFVPETMDVNTLLNEMQSSKKSISIVVDQYGGTSGLVTTEDLLEELVGEIEDEYDPEESSKDVYVIDEKNYIVQGYVEVDYLNDEYGMNLLLEDYETIAGLIISKIAKIPAKGQIVKCGKWRIEIISVSNKKIKQVKMTEIS